MSSRLLWAYPSDFRRRYGDELLATMAEVSGGRAPGLAARAHLVAAGVRQRFRVPLRPWAILAAVLAMVAVGAAGAAGGRWLGWQTGADVPSRDGMRALTDSMGVYWPELYDQRTAMGGPSAWAIANGPEIDDRARAALTADGWRITAYTTVSSAILTDVSTEPFASVPARNVMFEAAKDGLALRGDSLTGAGRTSLRVDVVADEAWAVRPFTVGGLALGALVGWLVAVALISRVRRGDRSHRRLAAARTAVVFTAGAVPVFELYRVFVRTLTYDSAAANPTYVLEGQAPAALLVAGTSIALLALAALVLVADRGSRGASAPAPSAA
uniref:hypothetical protein n=1 Tax=Paractinoplanes polyasparticus TaxID=2856853 RepID=UPI001C86633A|nr:hypothetical protein [Actinoplanes polyasparticus]